MFPQRHFGRLQRLPGAVARSAQTESQRTVQQKGSNAQTASQQRRSSQYGPSCWKQRLPAKVLPQVKQNWLAQSTQVWSHVSVQQFGSIAQTWLQQAGSAQFGFSWTLRQLPVAGSPHSSVSCTAIATQSALQPVAQQSGSIAQTASQTRPEEHDGAACGLKQLSGTLPQSEQNFVASATHRPSQPTSQHAGSIEQTSAQHEGLLHPGTSGFSTKQLFGELVQPCADAPRTAARNATPSATATAVNSRIDELRRPKGLWVGMEETGEELAARGAGAACWQASDACIGDEETVAVLRGLMG